MKKLLTITMFAGLSALLFSSCKGKDKAAGGDPKTVLIAFFERMSQKDIEGAAKLCTEDSKTTLDMMKKAFDAEKSMKMEDKDDGTDDFKDMEFGDVKIDGDKATVMVTNKKKSETMEFPLKKEGGAWKVDFTMGTLMKMGMDAEKNKEGMDMDMNDMDTTGLKNFQDLMNNDSIKEQLEKAKEMLDKLDKDDGTTTDDQKENN